jgi:hypothetical protein
VAALHPGERAGGEVVEPRGQPVQRAQQQLAVGRRQPQGVGAGDSEAAVDRRQLVASAGQQRGVLRQPVGVGGGVLRPRRRQLVLAGGCQQQVLVDHQHVEVAHHLLLGPVVGLAQLRGPSFGQLQ